MSFLTPIKMLALDVDGVMTDGIIYYSPSGDAMKGFSARDGMGISLIRAAGIQTALVTAAAHPWSSSGRRICISTTSPGLLAQAFGHAAVV